ncbi:MAG: C1 family peptidase, partial [Planctomycetota bacterium]|nr:C1 family peptidase [Planctomycetota bacterium]
TQYASEPIVACGNQCSGWNLKDTWDLWMVHGSVPVTAIPYTSADLAVPTCESVRAMTGCGGGVLNPHGGAPSTGPTSRGHQTAIPVPIQPFEASFGFSNPTAAPMIGTIEDVTTRAVPGTIPMAMPRSGLGVGTPPRRDTHTCSPARTTLVTVIPTPLNRFTQADDPFAVKSETNTMASNAAAMKAILAAAPEDGGGPIQAGFTVTQDFTAYESGVFQPTSDSVIGGHAVEIVGYDDTSDPPSWIVRNSWGPEWGDGGFFKIRQYLHPSELPDIPNFLTFETTAHTGTPV